MFKISKIEHRAETRIKLAFPYDAAIIEKVKKLDSARYSASMKSWHIPYTKEAFNNFKTLNIPYTTLPNSGTTGTVDPLSVRTSISPKGESIVSDPINTSSGHAIIQKFSGAQVVLTGKVFVISINYTEGNTDFLKRLKGTWWNTRQKVWISKATPENMEAIAQEFRPWDEKQYQVIKDIVYAMYHPAHMEIYLLPERKDKVAIQLTGYRSDPSYLKSVPDREYDKLYKRWLVPRDGKIVERIIKYYTGNGVDVKNKIPSDDTSIYHKNRKTYSNTKNRILQNTASRYEGIIADYLDTMIRERYSHDTLRSYSRELYNYMKAVDPIDISKADAKDVNRYLSMTRNSKISQSKLNVITSAIKLYYKKTIYRVDFEMEKIKRPKKAFNLPNILSVQEVERMLVSCKNLKHTTIMYTLYSSGLRLNEVRNLRVEDVLWERNQLYIKSSKGKKDRYVMLSKALKGLLRTYFEEYKPEYWLYEGQDRKSQYASSSIQAVVRKAAKVAGISKRVTPHMLRHCFATHLHEQGTSIKYIQELLGHKDIKTTMIYTHISNIEIGRIKSPIDRMNLKKPNFGKK